MADPADFDWDALRAMWIEHADRAAATMAEAHPDETFFVLVFMLDEELNGPMIAMNSLEALEIDADQRAGDFYDDPWSPFEWGERECVAYNDPQGENVGRYGALQAFAKDGPHSHWLAVHAREEELIVEVAQAVAERAWQHVGAFARLKMADDFVVFAREHDVRHPFYMARRSIAPAVLQRFFAKDLELDRQRIEIAAKPEAERIAYLISRLATFDPPVSSEEAGEQLVALGAAAVPALIALLDEAHDTGDYDDDDDIGWKAAMHLAEIGAPAAEPAADALLVAARRNKHTAAWAANALGKLGRFDQLMTLQGGSVSGLAAGRPRSYPYLETLLDRGDKKLTKSVESVLRPGSSSYELTPETFVVAAAHSTSKHAAIRQDVALAIGDPGIGPAHIPRAVTILIGLLDDKTADVRRLAALGLERLRRDAIAAVPRLRELQKDKVKSVAETATTAIAEITWKKPARPQKTTAP